MKKLLITLLLAVLSTSAMAGWTLIGSTEDKTSDNYIDKTTIRKRGNVAKMWNMHDFKSPQESAGGKSYLSKKLLYEYDCVEIRYRSLVSTFFSGNIGKGGAVLNYQHDEEWTDAEPDSVGMGNWKAACKK